MLTQMRTHSRLVTSLVQQFFAVLKQTSNSGGVPLRTSGLLVPHLLVLYGAKNWHIFLPKDYSVDDPEFPSHVLAKQTSIFGPFPMSYRDIADEERQSIFILLSAYLKENRSLKPFSMAEDPELTMGDRNFICRIMRRDPRDRPTAKELLEDPWFH